MGNKYTVYFKNSYGDKRKIGEAISIKFIYKIIDNFLKDHNYKSFYKRMWDEGNSTVIDVGSYTEFFYVEPKIFMDK